MRQLVSAAEAARYVSVPVGTVRNWRERGLLSPVARRRGRGGALLYRLDDVLDAERLTRQRDNAARRASRLAVIASGQAVSLSSWDDWRSTDASCAEGRPSPERSSSVRRH